ncbi:hypothetical protein KC352_g15 [Hortaea werneckii]|nr:hypothetical protein KC352_g15 [Hortaea werneckii]
MTTYVPSLTLPAITFEHPAAAILLPIAAGTAVGFSTRPKETQRTYLALRQPPLRPPPQVFGPVWTLLYGLMGYAAYRAWNAGVGSFDAKKVLLAKHSKELPSIRSSWPRLTLLLLWGSQGISHTSGVRSTRSRVGAGYLNNWDFGGKEVPKDK